MLLYFDRKGGANDYQTRLGGGPSRGSVETPDPAQGQELALMTDRHAYPCVPVTIF